VRLVKGCSRLAMSRACVLDKAVLDKLDIGLSHSRVGKIYLMIWTT
jgi:hypothetical protein